MEGEVVDRPETRRDDLPRPAGEREPDQRAAVQVGHPDRAVVDLDPVGAEAAHRRERFAGGEGGDASARHPPDRGAERVGDEEVAGGRVARDAVLEPGRRQRGDLDRRGAGTDPVEAGRRGAGRDRDVQVAAGRPDDAAEEQFLVDDGDVAVIRHRDAGEDADASAGRDPADFAGVGEGQVRGAVGLQGDVLRLLPGGEVEGNDPRRRERGRGRQGERGGRGQHGADLLDAQG
ncbi:Uncharacterised protein [Amycolatopsis camponoti]|uniref:Uncharacterized protein n=1 Tax=Amycolatopsis camponoti TaxID=2606593 RepID=A0A6I8LJU6_9PSEU|nr:Uncharacterised protein [Amycolatopsis camponoti]